MKKKVTALMLIMLMLCTGLLSACGREDTQEDSAETVTTEEDAAAGTEEDASSGADEEQVDWNDIEEQPEIDPGALSNTEGIDVDLTILSSTMVYSVVNDMLTRPNEYIGKTVRMSGLMSVYHDEETGNTYYACLIQDATACCSQGIEFVTTDEFPPEDYPADGEEVTVTGIYDLYEDDGYQYCVLKESSLG